MPSARERKRRRVKPTSSKSESRTYTSKVTVFVTDSSLNVILRGDRILPSRLIPVHAPKITNAILMPCLPSLLST